MSLSLLVFGANGQLGHELIRLAPTRGVRMTALSRSDVDLTDTAAIKAAIAAARPDAVINAAAYTAVDKAESEEALANQVNRDAPGAMAEATAGLGIPLVHVSTDYVFDGSKQGPYRETDPTGPVSAYGRSKLAGEQAVVAANPQHLILRTAWVYSAHGNNFVKTMLRVGGDRDELRVVADQHGIPTSAADLAAACLTGLERAMEQGGESWGIYHCSGAGPTTWHGFAEEIFEQAAKRWQRRPTVAAITTADYPTPAKRPANSVLDCSLLTTRLGIQPRPWQDALADVMAELLDA
jgi:dTDP-4-dehydrorhamnose reductase